MTQSHKCTLVPASYFNEGASRCILSDLFEIEPGESVNHLEVPEYGVVLLYATAGDMEPSLGEALKALSSCTEHNKLVFRYCDGYLDLAIAQGEKLLLANTYQADDFTTAEYFLFLALKSLQINPEVSTISVISPISDEEELSLYHYFQSVERK